MCAHIQLWRTATVQPGSIIINRFAFELWNSNNHKTKSFEMFKIRIKIWDDPRRSKSTQGKRSYFKVNKLKSDAEIGSLRIQCGVELQ